MTKFGYQAVALHLRQVDYDAVYGLEPVFDQETARSGCIRLTPEEALTDLREFMRGLGKEIQVPNLGPYGSPFVFHKRQYFIRVVSEEEAKGEHLSWPPELCEPEEEDW